MNKTTQKLTEEIINKIDDNRPQDISEDREFLEAVMDRIKCYIECLDEEQKE